MMDIVLIKLVIAHLIGDFFLQPNKWVADKERKKLKSNKLYLHIAIHTALVFIVLGSLHSWPIALSIGLFHFIIDACKLLFQKEKSKRIWFFADQIFHLTSIFCCWTYFYNITFNLNGILQNQNSWLFLLGALFLTTPTAIIIRVVIAQFIPTKSTTSLQNAGKFIGVLERLLIYLFILTNHFEAVGFLLAAKSIFRFGDLKDAQDIKLTEYVLIGTLLSFGVATLVAMLLFPLGNE